MGEFSNSFAKEIEKEYDLQVVGSGVSMPVKVDSIFLHFSSNRSITVERGRSLAVSVTNLFIKRMNEDINLTQYLANNPASISNVQLALNFEDNDQNPLCAIIVLGTKNLVTYYKYNDKHTKLINMHRETFEEAERIVQQESFSLSTPLERE